MPPSPAIAARAPAAPPAKSWPWLLFRLSRRLLPHWRVCNVALMAYVYRLRHGRWPRRPGAPDATINDFIFDRLTRRLWSVFEQACSDKITAKLIARGLADVQTAPTAAVFALTPASTAAEVQRWLAPYLGRRFVLKPAHSSGQVMFLQRDFDTAALERLLRHAKRNYAALYREEQYARLPKRLMIEPDLDTEWTGGISDVKFFCAGGEVLLCELDYTRFTGHARLLVTVPDAAVLDCSWKNLPRPAAPAVPANFADLVKVAAQLCQPFEFVRVDLYNTAAGIFFGEFTLTPGAGMQALSDEAFAIDLLRRVRQAQRAA